MSNPTVVEYCACAVPKVVFDDETAQNICVNCGGVINESDRVIVNLAMLRISDKALELAELNKLQAQQIHELSQLMRDWADVLTPPSEED